MPEPIARPGHAGSACSLDGRSADQPAWLMVVVLAVARLRQTEGIIVAIAALAASAITSRSLARADRDRWRTPIENMTRSVRDLTPEPRCRSFRWRRSPSWRANRRNCRSRKKASQSVEQVTANRAWLRLNLRRQPPPAPSNRIPDTKWAVRRATVVVGTHHSNADANHFRRLLDGRHGQSARPGWVSLDRVEHRRTNLLGWTLAELRHKSFLDTVHPDDRGRAEETFGLALLRGEALGLVVRMRTAYGKTRAIEVNVGARYGANQKVTHLRCHLTDVTDKVRAERELRLRNARAHPGQRAIATDQPRARRAEESIQRPLRKRACHVL